MWGPTRNLVPIGLTVLTDKQSIYTEGKSQSEDDNKFYRFLEIIRRFRDFNLTLKFFVLNILQQQRGVKNMKDLKLNRNKL